MAYIAVVPKGTTEELSHGHKYIKKIWKNGKWQYFYDTAITGKKYLNDAKKAETDYRNADYTEKRADAYARKSKDEWSQAINLDFAYTNSAYNNDFQAQSYAGKAAAAAAMRDAYKKNGDTLLRMNRVTEAEKAYEKAREENDKYLRLKAASEDYAERKKKDDEVAREYKKKASTAQDNIYTYTNSYAKSTYFKAESAAKRNDAYDKYYNKSLAGIAKKTISKGSNFVKKLFGK